MRPSGNRLESVRGSRAIYAFSNRDMWSQALIGAGYIIGAVALIGESVRRGVVAIGLLLSRAVLSLSRPWTRRVCTLRPYAAAGSFLAPSATPDFAARRRIPDLLLRDISRPPHTAAFGVEPPRSGARTRRSETGASRPLRRIPADVSFFWLTAGIQPVGGDRSSCPHTCRSQHPVRTGSVEW